MYDTPRLSESTLQNEGRRSPAPPEIDQNFGCEFTCCHAAEQGDHVDVWAEFCDAAGRTDDDALIALGVSERWLSSGAARYGIQNILPSSDGTYEPADHGIEAIVVPARPLRDHDYNHEDLGDLIAFAI